MLSSTGVDLLQGAATWGWVVVSFVQQVIVSTVPGLPEQILLVRLLPEATVPQMLYVFFLNLSLQFPHTSSVLSSEIILDIEGDPHVCGLPLYVELVARLQAVQRVRDEKRGEKRDEDKE